MNIKWEGAIQMKITLKEQECIGNSSFSGQIFYTRAFGEIFKEKTTAVILTSMGLILNRVRSIGADYLQVLIAETGDSKIKFWVISDEVTTFLLPSDY